MFSYIFVKLRPIKSLYLKCYMKENRELVLLRANVNHRQSLGGLPIKVIHRRTWHMTIERLNNDTYFSWSHCARNI